LSFGRGFLECLARRAGCLDAVEHRDAGLAGGEMLRSALSRPLVEQDVRGLDGVVDLVSNAGLPEMDGNRLVEPTASHAATPHATRTQCCYAAAGSSKRALERKQTQ
jgi:hypothetical protein